MYRTGELKTEQQTKYRVITTKAGIYIGIHIYMALNNFFTSIS